MTRHVKCDNCGRLQLEPFRLSAQEERDEAWDARKDQVLISLEHNEDAQSFDACSWACVAELALRQAAEAATGGGEGEQ